MLGRRPRSAAMGTPPPRNPRSSGIGIHLKVQPSKTAPAPTNRNEKTPAHRFSMRISGKTRRLGSDKQNARDSLRDANSVAKLGSFGFNKKGPAFGRVRPSPVLSVLGPKWFAEFTAVNISGNVIWCNFELARELGFDVPSSNRMTPQFHQQLIDALAYRVLARGEDAGARRTITLYADKY